VNPSHCMPDLQYDPIREHPELQSLFHQLNNQLGIVLAHAEMLETKAHDEVTRARALQVVTSVLEALGTAKEIRRHSESLGI
jgi:hypothetical protein